MLELDPTVPVVSNMILLDSEGKRIAVKYYDDKWATVEQQAEYEKVLFAKTHKTVSKSEEITMFDDVVVSFKMSNDLIFYVTGSQDENELTFSSLLLTFYDSIAQLLRGQVDKRTVLENLDLVLLVMDEIVEGGIVMETDSAEVASRVTMRESGSEVSQLRDQAVQQALSSVKEYAKQFMM